MKRLLLVLLVACGSSSNPPAAAAPGPTATPAPSAPPVPTLPVATNAAGNAVDCAATDQAAEYCAHVKDACCGQFQSWVCNNARYVDWFAAQCRSR